MAEVENVDSSTTTTKESDSAREALAKLLADKRAGPEASTVRKIIWFWTTLADLDMKGKESYRVVAATRRLVEGALPSSALSGLSPIQARRGMLRVKDKSIFGGPIGLLEISLVAKDEAALKAHVEALKLVGLIAMSPEDSFDERHCCHMLVPKLDCVQPLYRKLVDLGGVTKLCYASGGGVPGQGAEKARLIVDVTAEELLRKIPELVTLEGGSHVVACELEADAGGQVARWPMSAGSGRMPGVGKLRFTLLSPGLSRFNFGPESPMRTWLAEMFACPAEEVRPQILSVEKGWKEAAYEVAVPDTDEGKRIRAHLIQASRGGWFSPEVGVHYGQYDDVVAPSLLFAEDRVQLARLEGAKDYVVEQAALSEDQSEQLSELSKMLGGLAEGAAKDRAASVKSTEALEDI